MLGSSETCLLWSPFSGIKESTCRWSVYDLRSALISASSKYPRSLSQKEGCCTESLIQSPTKHCDTSKVQNCFESFWPCCASGPEEAPSPRRLARPSTQATDNAKVRGGAKATVRSLGLPNASRNRRRATCSITRRCLRLVRQFLVSKWVQNVQHTAQS